ncbi:hypothetical protein EMCRGX_G031489 [Ephydatia muelleri]
MASCYTLGEVANHSSFNDAWVAVDDKVYNITPFLKSHPGGMAITKEYLGKDISDVIHTSSVHQHSDTAYAMLQDFHIGYLTKTQRGTKETEAPGSELLAQKKWKEEEIVDWSKPMLVQVHRVGNLYDQWIHVPVDKELRLFESNFMEFFSKSPWWVVPSVWVPVILYILYMSVFGGPSVMPWIPETPRLTYVEVFCYASAGILLWTLIEYSLHRFIFHAIPPSSSRFLMTMHFMLHGQHHKVPMDPFRLVFPPVPAAIIVAILYFPAQHFVPLSIGRALLAGGLIGYVCYDLTHYYVHHGTPTPKSYFASMKSYHMAHHYRNHNRGFGISSKLWDVILDTVLH